jgi:hypothetical protein
MIETITRIREAHDAKRHLPGDQRAGCAACETLDELEAAARSTVTDELGELVSALATAQGAFTAPKRSRTADAGTYRYTYADLSDVLAAVTPALSANGIALTQDARVDLERKTITLTTTLRRGAAELRFGPFELPIARTDAQGIGSAETYARRYQLSTALGIAAEDDDDGRRSASTPAAAGPKATAAVMKRLHALAASRGVTHKEMTDWAGRHLGIETLAELTRDGAAAMEASLRDLPEVDAAATVKGASSSPGGRASSQGAERAGGGSDDATLGRGDGAGALPPSGAGA